MQAINVSEQVTPRVSTLGAIQQVVYFALHVVAVYALANISTPWLSGFVHGQVLPVIQQHPPAISSFQFLFSHLFMFSFLPSLAVALFYAHWFRHKVALFVWLIPLAVLAYKLASFPAWSVLDEGTQFGRAFRYYFGGDFFIPEYHKYEELFSLVGSSSDTWRGMAQLHFTAPLYAAIGYSLGTLLALRVPVPKLRSAIEKMRPSSSPQE
jgi:hypothetical protein